jgi:hypothetical protein
MLVIKNHIFMLTCCDMAFISTEKKRNYLQCNRTTSYSQSLQRVRLALLTDWLNKTKEPSDGYTAYLDNESYDICSLCPLNRHQSNEIRKQQSKLQKIHLLHYFVRLLLR